MLPEAEELLARAAKGERLTTRERRHCITFNIVKDPGATNVSMAKLFQVSERQVRLDKQHLRNERAKLLKEDDVGLIVADISIAFDNQIVDIEKSKKSAKPGSKVYLDHCQAIIELRLKAVKSLQDLGWLPKSLGNMIVDRFDYSAVVSKDGSVSTQPTHLIPERVPARIEQAKSDEPQTIEAEFIDVDPASEVTA